MSYSCLLQTCSSLVLIIIYIIWVTDYFIHASISLLLSLFNCFTTQTGDVFVVALFFLIVLKSDSVKFLCSKMHTEFNDDQEQSLKILS